LVLINTEFVFILTKFKIKEEMKYKMFNEYPDILTVEQLQQILKIGRNTAYKLLQNNKIKSIRIGKVHKIPKINVIEYLNKKIKK
jgi:excisionase family DNA binding protein